MVTCAASRQTSLYLRPRLSLSVGVYPLLRGSSGVCFVDDEAQESRERGKSVTKSLRFSPDPTKEN